MLIFLVQNLDLDIWSTPALILTSHQGSLWISPKPLFFCRHLFPMGVQTLLFSSNVLFSRRNSDDKALKMGSKHFWSHIKFHLLFFEMLTQIHLVSWLQGTAGSFDKAKILSYLPLLIYVSTQHQIKLIMWSLESRKLNGFDFVKKGGNDLA